MNGARRRAAGPAPASQGRGGPAVIFAACMAALVTAGITRAAPAAAQAPGRPEARAPEAPRSGFITTSDGVRIHYLEAGRGPALLFVPGWTMPAEIWEPQIAHFARTHRVVAMDPRSQGRSDKPTEGHYPERRAHDVRELVQTLRLEPVVLVGWSLAVPELLTYVDLFGTGGVHGLVLVDGQVGGEPDPEFDAAFRRMLRAAHQDRANFTRAFVRSMYRRPQSEEYLARITTASLQTPTTAAFALLAHLLVSDADWRPVLPRVDRPLLYVATPALAAQAEVVRTRAPHAHIEIIDAGHALFVDEPERFNRALEAFLAGLR